MLDWNLVIDVVLCMSQILPLQTTSSFAECPYSNSDHYKKHTQNRQPAKRANQFRRLAVIGRPTLLRQVSVPADLQTRQVTAN